MPFATPLRAAFNAGELSPRLAARTDFDKYNAGQEILENMVPLGEGGIMRRAGTRYVAGTKDGTDVSRLRSFVYSTTQAYMLEQGANYLRFFRNQGQIVAGNTDAAVTNGTFGSDIASWNNNSSLGGAVAWSSSDASLEFTITSSSDKAAIDQSITFSSSYVGNEHILKFQVKGRAGDHVNLKIGTSSSLADLVSAISKNSGFHAVPFTPTSSGFSLQFEYLGSERTMAGSTLMFNNIDDISIETSGVLELQTPWGSSLAFDVEGPQSADVLYMFQKDTHPYKLIRRGHTNWSLEKILFVDGPYLDANAPELSDTTLNAASTDGRYALVTASTTTAINDDTGFGSSDIGRVLRISTSSAVSWGYGLVVASTSTTTVRVDVKRDFPGTGAKPDWALGSWTDYSGWPSVGTFHEQRLYAAGNNTQPQTFWASQTADFENFGPDSFASSDATLYNGTVNDDDGLNFTISSNDVEAIQWLESATRLQIGTKAGEWEVSSNGAVITPTDVEVVRHTTHGSAKIQPVKIGPATLFVQRAKRRVRELSFEFAKDSLVAVDLTRLAPHITRTGIVEMAYQEEPDSVVWAARSDGQLLSMTYRRDEDVVAWGRHILGGSYGSTNAHVKSVATIPGSTASGQTQDSDDRDEVWMIVERTIDGSTVRYVEFMERDYETGDAQEDAYYVDSCLTYDSTSATALTGSSHLAGQTAKVLANGAIHPDVSISSSAGTLTLDYASSTVQVGLGYTHRVKTLKWEAGSAFGTAQGKKKRIAAVTAIVDNSLTLELGASSSQLVKYDFREVGDAMDTAPPLFTGETFIEIEQDWQLDPRLVVESDDPAPFTLLGLVPEMKTNR